MNKCPGWKLYNHAVIPLCAPHEEPDLRPIIDGSIWKMPSRPLFARWTTDFDCGYETNWWYNIRKAPFLVEKLSKSSQKHIRQSLKKCYVKKINALENAEALYALYEAAFDKYENADNRVNYTAFFNGLKGNVDNGFEFFGGYNAQNDQLIGYMVLKPFPTYVELQTAKFDPAFLHLGVSAALYTTILTYYLNELGKKYICSGARSINHKTNTEQYKIRHFGYERAYCKLHIEYNPIMKPIVRILYPFRKHLLYFDKITLIHQINAVLKMEEIIRNAE